VAGRSFGPRRTDSLRIGLVFCGDHISVEDGAREGGSASISADFLSIAGLASGRANPIGLLARRRVSRSFPAARRTVPVPGLDSHA